MIHTSWAQSITMGCTQVTENGDVNIVWPNNYSFPAGYTYQIFASTNLQGTYTGIGNISNPMTFVHHANSALTQQWFYYIEGTDGNIIFRSDTVGTIVLGITNSGKGSARLDYFAPYQPLAKPFTVYRGLTEEALAIVDTTSALFYSDTTHYCGEMLTYQVAVADNRGCNFQSSPFSDMYSDFLAPDIPTLDTVSINPNTNHIEIGWDRPKDEDLIGYIIYIFKDGIWDDVDTIFGAENTFYIDTANSADEVQQYRICSIDTCRNASPLGDVHHTLSLSANPDKCDSSVVLTWNAYENMPGGTTNYHIFASENGDPFVQIGDVAGNQLNFKHEKANTSSNYTYYIQAYNSQNQFSSSSMKTDVVFNRTIGYGNSLLRYVSVKDNDHVEIAVYIPDSIIYHQISVYKSIDKNSFSLLDTKSKSPNLSTYTFIDTNIDVAMEQCYYFAAATDECDVLFAYTDTVSNIVLQLSDAAADLINLQWTDYEGFINLDCYEIWRQTQSETTLSYLDNTQSQEYADNVWDYHESGAKFKYQILAKEDHGNPYGFEDISYSNIVEAQKDPNNFIPNTFRPNSEIEANRIFKPVLSYVDADEYHFIIYDRWGQMMFETTDLTEGWDGTVKGKPAELGVYSYVITYRLNEKKMYSKYGHVTLIR